MLRLSNINTVIHEWTQTHTLRESTMVWVHLCECVCTGISVATINGYAGFSIKIIMLNMGKFAYGDFWLRLWPQQMNTTKYCVTFDNGPTSCKIPG